LSWISYRDWPIKVISSRDHVKLTTLYNRGWIIRDATQNEVQRWFKTGTEKFGEVADEFFTKEGAQLLLLHDNFLDKVSGKKSRKEARQEARQEAKRIKREKKKKKRESIGFKTTSYEKEAVRDL
jgi:hypothetical protein